MTGDQGDRKKEGSNTWIIVLVVILVGGMIAIFATGILAALAIYGMRRYLANAKALEAREGISLVARGMVTCYETQGSLPPTSNPVPVSPPRGGKYQSVPGDWDQEAFRCASFSWSGPQYFSFQWVRDASTETGRAVARGDLDGDGTESEYVLRVECSDGLCTIAPSIEERDPFE